MKTDYPLLNAVWADLVAEELVRQGIKMVCLAPGSRSAPLAVAFFSHEGLETLVHIDERSLGFYALGIAKATGEPVAIVITSGTAVANLLPAIVEAAQDHVPLIVLTADRPPELIGTGANQAIDQVKIFGDYTVYQTVIGPPCLEVSPRYVVSTIGYAVFFSRRFGGPVHINMMFREPLVAPGKIQDFSDYLVPLKKWMASGQPYTTYFPCLPTLPDLALAQLLPFLSGQKGVIIAGQLSLSESDAVLRFAEAAGWVVLPDVTSQLRLRMHPLVVTYAEVLLGQGDVVDQMACDVIFHIGGRLTGKHLMAFASKIDPAVSYVQISPNSSKQDPDHRVTLRIEADIEETCRLLSEQVKPSFERQNVLLSASDEISSFFDHVLLPENLLTEQALSHFLSRTLPETVGLFLGNSLPIRMMAIAGVARLDAPVVQANRGASGIDGLISTAAGWAQGRQKPVVLLVGDVSALHDLTALHLVARSAVPVIVMVVNNSGGGIFSYLPVAACGAAFESCFQTPIEVKFDSVSAGFGMPYYRVSTTLSLDEIVRPLFDAPVSCLVEIVVPIKETLSFSEALSAHVDSYFSPKASS